MKLSFFLCMVNQLPPTKRSRTIQSCHQFPSTQFTEFSGNLALHSKIGNIFSGLPCLLQKIWHQQTQNSFFSAIFWLSFNLFTGIPFAVLVMSISNSFFLACYDMFCLTLLNVFLAGWLPPHWRRAAPQRSITAVLVHQLKALCFFIWFICWLRLPH